MNPITKIFLAGICMATLFCGCNKPDPQIAKLTAKISSLETNLADVTLRLNNQRTFQDNLFSIQTNMADIMRTNNYAMEIQEAEMAGLEFRLDNLISSVSNYFAGHSVAKMNSAGLARIPDNVVTQIRNAAVAKWPNEYDMQVYEFKMQVQAWYKMNALN